MTQRQRTSLQALLLAAVTLAAFASAFCAGFVWDDDQHITQNWNLRSAQGLVNIWSDPHASPQYYPLSHTTWWLEYQLWGLNSLGYHTDNILLHAANALLLWLLLRRLAIPGALFAALLFAVHPLQVETVAWIMERKNLLSAFFYLLAFHAYVRFFALDGLPSPKKKASPPSPKLYILGTLCFIAALLSKSVAATLPAAFLLVVWWKRPRIEKCHWQFMLPLLALGIASGLFTAYLEQTHVGASGPEFAFSPAARLLIAGRAFWTYLTLLLSPWPQMFFYPRWSIDPASVLQYFYPLAAITLVAVLWWKRASLGKAPLAAILFFLGTLFPALGFINVFPMRYSFVADHFQYMACIGPLTLFAAVCCLLLRHRPRLGPVILTLQAAIIAIFAALSFNRGLVFRDAATLYADTLTKNPGSWGAHALLAQELLHQRQFTGAVEHFSEAARLNPAVLNNAEGLGNALLAAGQVDRAREVLEEVLRKDPERATAYNDLAAVYVVMHQPEHAAQLYTQAIHRNPSLAEAHYNLADIFAAAGQWAPAQHEYATALDLRSEWPEAAFKLGACFAEQGKLSDALPWFERALAQRSTFTEARQAITRIRAALGR